MSRYKIIMLESKNGKASYPPILKQYSSGKLIIGLTSQKDIVQHFYLIDTEAEIKEGDWVYYPNNFQNKVLQVSNASISRKWYKIICSTDKSIKLPQLSKQSIQLLIDYYNSNGKMPDEVEVEMIENPEDFGCDPAYFGEPSHIIKLNPQGEVDITIPEEKMYSKEEVRKLLQLALATGGAYGMVMNQANANSWIKDNLK